MSWTYNPFTNNFDFYKDPYREGSLSAFNGTFQESFDALVTSDGATVTMSLEQKGGGDLSMNFSDGKSTLDCTPAATITLTAGTDAAPQVNYIYVLQSTKVLTLSTSDWPTAEHIKVAYFFVPSATFVQTNGVYINQNWNDEFVDTNNQGHISHMAERLRHEGAVYNTGIAGAGTDGYLTPTASSVELKATSGVVYQMHKHTVPAFDTSVADMVLVANWSGDAYHDITNLFDITADSTGATIGNNKYFNIVIWAVANKGGEYTPMMLNLPSGFYNTQADAESDVSNYDISTIPPEYKTESSTGYLIARITCQMQTTWNVTKTVDLRGADPFTIGGGSGIGAGVTAYINLTDTPTSYAGSGGYTVKVNSDENAVEFVVPVTTDYTIYVSDATRGGTSDATGLELTSGTADGTSASKLIDSAGGFTAGLLNKTLYNVTDDKWAKVTAVDSATQLSLSGNVMASGEDYVISDSFLTLADAWNSNSVPNGYLANIIFRCRNSLYSDDIDFSGKLAGAPGKTITIQGNLTGNSRISGIVSIRQPIKFNRVQFRNRVFEYFGADVDWTASGTNTDNRGIIRKSDNVQNVFNSIGAGALSYDFLNDSGPITDVLGTVNTAYNLYLATSAFGGDDANDGLRISIGAATSTTANKLVDSTASFTTAHLNMTLWNSTDETWAKITAIDSSTTVSISIDIMASGESYVIAAAKLTGQNVVDAIPSTIAVGATVSIRCSDGTFSDNHQLEGKTFAGPDTIWIYGTPQIDYSGLVGTGGTQGTGAADGTITDTGLTAGQFDGKLIRMTSGPNSGDIERVDTNTTTLVTICGAFNNAPGGTDGYEIISPATIWEGSAWGLQVKAGQQGVKLQMMKFSVSVAGFNPIIMSVGGEIRDSIYCDFAGAGHVGINSYSRFVTNKAFFECWDTTSKRSLRYANAAGTVSRSRFFRPSDATTGGDLLILGDLSRVAINKGCVFDGNSIGSMNGISVSNTGAAVFFSSAADVYTTVKNCNVGIDATVLSWTSSILTPAVDFAGNTTDHQADATSVIG